MVAILVLFRRVGVLRGGCEGGVVSVASKRVGEVLCFLSMVYLCKRATGWGIVDGERVVRMG